MEHVLFFIFATCLQLLKISSAMVLLMFGIDHHIALHDMYFTLWVVKVRTVELDEQPRIERAKTGLLREDR